MCTALISYSRLSGDLVADVNTKKCSVLSDNKSFLFVACHGVRMPSEYFKSMNIFHILG